MSIDQTVVAGSAVACVALLTLYLVVRTRQRGRGPFLPDSFLIGLLLFSAGGTYVAWISPSVEAQHVAVLGNSAFLSGIVGATVAILVTGPAYRGYTFEERLACVSLRRFDRRFALWSGVAVVSVTVGFLYLVLTGPVAQVFRTLAAFVSDAALLDVRKSIASGREGYLAPGYVKQFRDILGPVIVIYLGWRRSRILHLAYVVLFALLVVSILLSGQRAPLLILVLCTLAGLHFARGREAVPATRGLVVALLLGALFLVLVAGMDILLGRATSDTFTWTAPLSSLEGLVERATVTVPRSNVATHDVWAFRGPTYGESWLQDLVALLPGRAGEMFTNILHEAHGGSSEGNLVLGMATDLWLAWGWPGLLLAPALFAGGVAFLDLALYHANSEIALAVRIYLFFALPIMYSPYGFMLYGGAVALIVLGSIGVWRELGRLARKQGHRTEQGRTIPRAHEAPT